MTLTYDIVIPKLIGFHLLVMANLQKKYEDCVIKLAETILKF